MRNYIRQILKNDCGYACLKMYLSYLFKDSSFLYLPQRLKDNPYNLFELITISMRSGVSLKAYFFDNKELLLSKIKIPFLASICINKSRHMVFIRKIFFGILCIFDPKDGIKFMKFSKFKKYWDGNVLVFDSFLSNIKVKKVKNIDGNKIIYGLSILSELVSNIFLIIGISFLNLENFTYLTIIGGIFFFIFTLLSKILINKNANIINNKIIKLLKNSRGVENKYEFLKAFIKYKYSSSNSYILMFSSILSLIIMTIIISLNMFINLYFIFLIVFAYFALKIIFHPFTKKIQNEIDLIEIKIRDFTLNIDQLVALLDNLQTKTNNLFYVLLIKKYFFYILLLILVIGLCYISNNFTINFGFFYLMVYLIIHNLVKKIDDSKTKIANEKLEKCKILSLINSKLDKF